ncbi:protein fem-1 homolog C [Condylostylus longicornis]|uniref:protein fem-1 homolog C n=1 Tax=Condylostylus longicornis TaxID=2530218 RepID=UPI00244DFCE5|nr:protein fem-1 homolog C [Condylostylus longicornis]
MNSSTFSDLCSSYTNKIFNSPNSLLCKIKSTNHELVEQCKRAIEGSQLTKGLRDELESLPREIRREIVKKVRNGCAPLFLVCKRGCVEIAEYLVTVCDADIEQRGLYEVPEDRSFHFGTPLWCAAVSGKLAIVKYLVSIGCDINAPSDSGSTPVRSACFMTHIDIVEYLVENGADISKPNINGGTCLINSVQSVSLCQFLISKGADVNAKDIQDKTALHYSIQEHRLETTKLLLEKGADPFAKSRSGDDALQTACLKGAHRIFDYLKSKLPYPLERLADAHELIGCTFLDEHNETRLAILHWRLALHMRHRDEDFIEKKPVIPLRAAYGYATEFKTAEELNNISTDVDAMRIQSLLICERILGISHKDMLFRLMFRGASYADALRFQRCIDLWRLTLEIRIERFSMLYSDTCFTAQALVRLMLDLFSRYNNLSPNDFNEQELPTFSDVLAVFLLLTNDIMEAQKLLQIKPVFRKQQENFDRVLKCITHLIYLLICIANSKSEKQLVIQSVHAINRQKIRSACTSDSLLHLCVSRLNVIKSTYFTDENNVRSIFPNFDVVKLLVETGSEINAKNEAKSTPLHVASLPYNYENDIVLYLLQNGADLDQPNKSDERPINMIASNPLNKIPLMNFINLKCLSATIINKYRIPYRNQIPKCLDDFVKQHEV